MDAKIASHKQSRGKLSRVTLDLVLSAPANRHLTMYHHGDKIWYAGLAREQTLYIKGYYITPCFLRKPETERNWNGMTHCFFFSFLWEIKSYSNFTTVILLSFSLGCEHSINLSRILIKLICEQSVPHPGINRWCVELQEAIGMRLCLHNYSEIRPMIIWN